MYPSSRNRVPIFSRDNDDPLREDLASPPSIRQHYVDSSAFQRATAHGPNVPGPISIPSLLDSKRNRENQYGPRSNIPVQQHAHQPYALSQTRMSAPDRFSFDNSFHYQGPGSQPLSGQYLQPVPSAPSMNAAFQHGPTTAARAIARPSVYMTDDYHRHQSHSGSLTPLLPPPDVHTAAEPSPSNSRSGESSPSSTHSSIPHQQLFLPRLYDPEIKQFSTQGKHQCSYCGKRFERPSGLRSHLNIHTKEQSYVCPEPGCKRSFNVRSNMLRHVRSLHQDVQPPYKSRRSPSADD